MLRSRIFPTLLIKDGGLVKSQKFTNYKYLGDPINAIKIFNEKEVDELTLFDIDATVFGKQPNFGLLEKISGESRMPLCYGGGVRDANTAAQIISIGYEKISISHSAIERPELVQEIAERIGSQSVVVTLDLKKSRLFGKHILYTHNGKVRHDVDPVEFAIQCAGLGAGEIALNAIDRDGTLQGLDDTLIRKFRKKISCQLSIIGGTQSALDMERIVDEFSPIGIGVGSIFVMKGRYRAVLLSYERPSNLF